MFSHQSKSISWFPINSNQLFTVGGKDQGKLQGMGSVWTVESVEGRQKEQICSQRPALGLEIFKMSNGHDNGETILTF